MLQSTLEFNLHTQNFIENIRDGDYMGAIDYSRKHLVDIEGMNPPERLQETMVLLAFKPDTHCEKYKVWCAMCIMAFQTRLEGGLNQSVDLFSKNRFCSITNSA